MALVKVWIGALVAVSLPSTCKPSSNRNPSKSSARLSFAAFDARPCPYHRILIHLRGNQ